MASAAAIAFKQSVDEGGHSFSTAATVCTRFERFVRFARDAGVGRLERVSPDIVQRFGEQLADLVENDEMSTAYAQNLVSAVNSVMTLMTRGDWSPVSPTVACRIRRRCHVRLTPPSGFDRELLQLGLDAVRQNGWNHGLLIAQLARDFGLRTKEAALLDASAALREARVSKQVTVHFGTKGGRPRRIPISNPRQLDSLSAAVLIQGKNRSLIPCDLSWKSFRAGELRWTRELLQRYGVTRLHELRAPYACERYITLSGYPPPVQGGKAPRELDAQVRQEVALELGHGRVDVTNSYLGGRRVYVD